MRCARSPRRPADRNTRLRRYQRDAVHLELTPVTPMITGSSPSCRPFLHSRRLMAVVAPRDAARLIRKERPDGSPLKVRKFVSHDSRPRFGSLNRAYLSVRNAELQSEKAPIADMLQISQKRRE